MRRSADGSFQSEHVAFYQQMAVGGVCTDDEAGMVAVFDAHHLDSPVKRSSSLPVPAKGRSAVVSLIGVAVDYVKMFWRKVGCQAGLEKYVECQASRFVSSCDDSHCFCCGVRKSVRFGRYIPDCPDSCSRKYRTSVPDGWEPHSQPSEYFPIQPGKSPLRS